MAYRQQRMGLTRVPVDAATSAVAAAAFVAAAAASAAVAAAPFQTASAAASWPAWSLLPSPVVQEGGTGWKGQRAGR